MQSPASRCIRLSILMRRHRHPCRQSVQPHKNIPALRGVVVQRSGQPAERHAQDDNCPQVIGALRRRARVFRRVQIHVH